jgi:hypothetical protein
MPGNRVMIRVNIYMGTFRICYKHNFFYNHSKNFRNIFGPMSS